MGAKIAGLQSLSSFKGGGHQGVSYEGKKNAQTFTDIVFQGVSYEASSNDIPDIIATHLVQTLGKCFKAKILI